MALNGKNFLILVAPYWNLNVVIDAIQLIDNDYISSSILEFK